MAEKQNKTGFFGNWIVKNLVAALVIVVVLLANLLLESFFLLQQLLNRRLFFAKIYVDGVGELRGGGVDFGHYEYNRKCEKCNECNT